MRTYLNLILKEEGRLSRLNRDNLTIILALCRVMLVPQPRRFRSWSIFMLPYSGSIVAPFVVLPSMLFLLWTCNLTNVKALFYWLFPSVVQHCLELLAIFLLEVRCCYYIYFFPLILFFVFLVVCWCSR